MKKIVYGHPLHFIAQSCQFKNIRKKDRAGIGPPVLWPGASFSLSPIISSSSLSLPGFGIPALEHNGVYVVYLLDYGFCGAVRDLSVRPWGIIRRFSSIPPAAGHADLGILC